MWNWLISMNRLVLSGAVVLFASVLLPACAREDQAENSEVAQTEVQAVNSLTTQEQEEGWQLLFDGQSLTGWRGLGRQDIPAEHWEVVDGTIHKVGKDSVKVQKDGQPIAGGDLMTVATYGDFELSFDWRVAPGGNSGIKYNVSESLSVAIPPPNAAIGFEYQILDDERHPDAKMGSGTNRRAASLYDLLAADTTKTVNPAGEWNQGRIVMRGNHGEHWLNGKKVLEFELGSPAFDSLFKASKYKDIKEFAVRRRGHIVLQDHNDNAWFRNLKIRENPPA